MLIFVVISPIYTTDILGCFFLPYLEEKARATYENLINLATDPDVIEPLQFLRQREIIHFQRFKELYEEYKKKGYDKRTIEEEK